jgi:hypothetical protein
MFPWQQGFAYMKSFDKEKMSCQFDESQGMQMNKKAHN